MSFNEIRVQGRKQAEIGWVGINYSFVKFEVFTGLLRKAVTYSKSCLGRELGVVNT